MPVRSGMIRIGLLVVAALAGASSLAACSTGGGEQSSQDLVGASVPIGRGGEEVTIGLTYVPNVQFAPVYVAAADEIFRAAEVGPVIRHHGTDEGLFTALTSGEEDVTVASGDEVLQSRAAGLDLVAIGTYYDEYPVAVISKADSGIDSLADLKGKSIGVPGEFGSNWFGLLAALDYAGLNISDVTVVSVGYTQAASLATDAVDAVVGFVNSDAVQLEQMGIETTVLPLSDFDVPLVGATIVTTREWLEDHQELARSVVEAITAGMDRVIQNPQHALEISANWDPSLRQGENRATAARLLEATIPLWERSDGKASAVQDIETWNRMAPFLSGILEVPESAMGIDQAVTNDFAN
ncbi:ABC transporter substrate-binding protein [Actinomycetaceae bacterium MB13-C1-2]|nr:ABC transporter substrate-binding protein [Actinomycetaceae bacterium MB13-C1-2]